MSICRLKEKLQFKVAWLMPKWLVYFCSIRMIAHATQGQYGNTIVPDLTSMTIDEAIQKATDLSLNIGAKVYDNTCGLLLDDKRIYMAHGDTINMTTGYQIFRSLLRSPLLKEHPFS